MRKIKLLSDMGSAFLGHKKAKYRANENSSKVQEIGMR